MQAVMETIFEVLYLLFAVSLGIYMLIKAKGRGKFILFGIASLILGVGDAFHLIPRMYALWNGGTSNFPDALGVGKFVTSITMTIFYVLIYYFLKVKFDKKVKWYIEVSILVLASSRIILCFLPQNEWTSANAPLIWGIIRNIPFVILGGFVVYLAIIWAKKDKAFKWLFLAIILSFVFYIPVVLFASMRSYIGLLMLPKTVCYMWILYMGIIDLYIDNKSKEIEEKGGKIE